MMVILFIKYGNGKNHTNSKEIIKQNICKYWIIVSTKTTSAIFLATVLLTGTITALSYSSFMTIVTVQAQPYYGMDRNTVAMNQIMEWIITTKNIWKR